MLVIAGGVLMWLAPASTFDPLSIIGAVLLPAGIALEAIDIALEHRQ